MNFITNVQFHTWVNNSHGTQHLIFPRVSKDTGRETEDITVLAEGLRSPGLDPSTIKTGYEGACL